MLIKHTLLALSLTFISIGQVYANIPIESRGLSQTNSGTFNTPPATTSTASNTSWDLIQQNQRLENQLRDLRGKIEEQDHQIDQLNKELTNRYTDLDQRLELLQQKIDPTDEATLEGEPEQTTPTNATPNNTQPASSPTASTDGQTANSNNQAELDKAAYTVAREAYKQGGAKKAIAPMQSFVKNNPNSIYTGNAYFWLAEFNLAIEPPNYDEAKKNYETVAAKFPDSGKAARSLYQLYSIAKDVNKNTQTAEVYKKKLISTYPQSEEAGFFKNS